MILRIGFIAHTHHTQKPTAAVYGFITKEPTASIKGEWYQKERPFGSGKKKSPKLEYNEISSVVKSFFPFLLVAGGSSVCFFKT